MIRAKLPLVAISFAGLSVIVYALAGLKDLLVYDRHAILAGELWRLATACLVHFSPSHLVWDLLVFTAAAWAIQFKGYKGLSVVFSLSAIIPSCYLFLFLPDLARFGGLSGPAIGATAYFCLREMNAAEKNRVIWMGVLVLLVLKIIVEAIVRTPIFADSGAVGFHVLPSVHAISLIVALVVYGIIQAAIPFTAETSDRIR